MRILIMTLLGLCIAQKALGNTEKEQPPPLTDAQLVYETIPPQKVSVEFWGNFSSASLQDLGAQKTPGGNGLPAQQEGLNSAYLSARYKLTETKSVGLTQNLGAGEHRGAYASAGDLGLSYRNDRLFQLGEVNISGEVLSFAPTSKASLAASQLASEKGVLVASYLVPDSRWSLGFYSLLQTSQHADAQQALLASSDDVYIYQAPFANYALSRKTSLSLWMDLVQIHERASQVSFDDIAIKPGISYELMKNVRVNPYINVVANNVEMASSYVGFFLSVTE